MADTKISAMTAATTPLVGTELVPLVQSAGNVQTSVANLTAGRAVSALNYTVTGSTVPANGVYLSTTNTLSWATNSAVKMTLNATGSLGLGSTSLVGYGFRNSKTITGATGAYAQYNDGVIQSDVTSVAYGFICSITPVAASFTLTTLRHVAVLPVAFGAGSSVTTQQAFFVSGATTAAANNYGYVSEIAAGANRWNVYMSGTAQNAFAGLTRFGGVTVPVNTVDITGSLGRGAPVTKTADFTLAATENWVIVNQAATTTVTLPAASAWSGREVMFKTIQLQTLVSASSNVVPRIGGAAGTAILAGVAGTWATLVSDGTNWIAMAGN